MATEALAETQPQRPPLRTDTFAQSVAMLMAIMVLQRGIGFMRSLFLCRWLPAEELGHWDLTLAFLELAAPIAVLSLPAVFPRYIEHYRQRGQLRRFLKRTGAATLLLTALSVALLYAGRSWFSRLLYNNPESVALVMLLVVTLPVLILFNTFVELFGGLRMYRAVSMLQFLQSVVFAAVALWLAAAWHAGADSIILGYAAGCAGCALLGLYWLTRLWPVLPEDTASHHAPLWRRLAPFVGALWLSNWLGNVFTIVGRAMLLHTSGMDADAALAAVGQYHSARIVPSLIISAAVLLATTTIPFFSSDWEAGRRRSVSARLNLLLKMSGFGLTLASLLVMLAAPLLFGVVFAGKFSAGEAILPWTLMASVWFSMFCITRTYLLCDERLSFVSLAFLIGIAVNVGANLVLLPKWGLLGAVLSACLANFVLLGAIYWFARRRGMRLNRGTWIVSVIPVALGLGPWIASAVLGVTCGIALTSRWVLTSEEKRQLAEFVGGGLDRVRKRYDRRWNR